MRRRAGTTARVSKIKIRDGCEVKGCVCVVRYGVEQCGSVGVWAVCGRPVVRVWVEYGGLPGAC